MNDLTEESLSSFPTEILDVFKARVRRKLTPGEEVSVKNRDVLNILHRIKFLMDKAELNLDGRRSTTLDTNS